MHTRTRIRQSMNVFFKVLLVCGVVLIRPGDCLLVQEREMMRVFQEVIPSSDGSLLAPGTENGETMVQNIKNNVKVLGLAMYCEGGVCEIDMSDTYIQTRVLMLAVLGNFVNTDLKDDDAIEHLQVDTGTGLLRRAHSNGWTRVMLTDVLLVLAVVMLGLRTLKTPAAP